MSTIFITGASSGMGKATAKLFAEKGWQVIAASRSIGNDLELAALENIETVTMDVTDPRQIRTVVADVLSRFDVDVLFNNAGAVLFGPVEEYTDEQLDHQLATNLLGPIRVSQAFLPHFRERRGGTIINTTSLTAMLPAPFMSVYSAAKAGLERWSFGVNLELNEFNIRVKTIVPGIVATNLMGAGTVVQSDAYAAHLGQVFAAFGDPATAELFSTAEGTAAVVFGAATDGSTRVRYLTDATAKEYVAMMVGFGEETTQAFASTVMFG
ncbi:SDR family oxidoreductase [Cryobacterium sp. N22]|uniref:SDR family oxidoreductase n=1 Tax=Cryobacterium sp. N22 TaxID=2048290 RepID=UPI000CE419A7|nr:SDR family oxidoreductase [Cryobacterium sp. N22]